MWGGAGIECQGVGREEVQRRLQGLLPEKDPLEVGSRVEGVSGNGTDLVILQVQVFEGRGQPLGDLCQLVPSDVQQLQR